MYDTPRDLTDALAAAPDALEGALTGVDDDLAARARGGDEEWSVLEVVCHLRDAEERAAQRTRAMRDEDDPQIASYDQAAWAVERRYASDNVRAAVAAFSRHRSGHVAALRALPAAAWTRAGRHEEWGRITIESHTIRVATHDIQHLAQIARALRDERSGRRTPPRLASEPGSGAAHRDPVWGTATRNGVTVRPATAGDAAAIARIYTEGIQDRTATFETRPRSAADVASWFDGRHPIVVVDDGRGTMVGFAATFEYRPRAAYAGVAEFSVYVARAARGQGVGRLAMQALIAAARSAGFWKLLSRVFVGNDASLALLRSLGFREVGTYERHGRLDGRWLDTVIVELMLPENQV